MHQSLRNLKLEMKSAWYNGTYGDCQAQLKGIGGSDVTKLDVGECDRGIWAL